MPHDQLPPPKPPRKRILLSEAQRREVIEQLLEIRRPLTPEEVDLLRAVYPWIYDVHYDTVWNKAKRRGIGFNALEDFTSATLGALFKNLCESGFPPNLAAHVRAMTDSRLANHVRDLRRHKRVGVSVPVPSSSSEKPRSSRPDVLQALVAREAAERRLPQLSPEHRQILELVYFDGLSTREAAELLDLKEGTAKSRLLKAKRALHKLAEQFMTESERGRR